MMTRISSLHHNQRTVVRLVVDGILARSEQSRKNGSFESIIGPRGAGKTTVLTCIEQTLHDRVTSISSPAFICTRLVETHDGISDDGLASEAIHAIWEAAQEPLGRAPAANEDGKPLSRLQHLYQDLVKRTLAQTESYRELARDMAMSAPHYAEILISQHSERRRLRDAFQGFLDALLGRLGDHHRFVVLVDDLDLAASAVIRSFVRGLLTDFQHPMLHWILSFDRDRLEESLSPPKPYPGSENQVQPDIVVGRNLVGKLLRDHATRTLSSWLPAEKLSFIPLDEPPSPSKTLGSLLQERQLLGLRDIVPSGPRGLDNIYRWLTLCELPAGDTAADYQGMLEQCIGLRGERSLVQELAGQNARTLLSDLHWSGGGSSSTVPASRLRDAILKGDPLPPLPLPHPFVEDLPIRRENRAPFLEALLDTVLQQGFLPPATLVHMFPPTERPIRQAVFRVDFDRRQLGDTFGDDPSRAHQWGLLWQGWEKGDSALSSGSYSTTIGPTVFWEGILDPLRNGPLEMLNRLRLEAEIYPDARLVRAQHGHDPRASLPRRIRPLLLLALDLGALPWGPISTFTKFWSPTAYSRVSAAFLLLAMARQLATEPLNRQLFGPWWAVWTSFHALTDWHEDKVFEQYASLVQRLSDGLDQLAPAHDLDFFRAAPLLSLHESLRSLVADPAIHYLADG